MKKMNAAYASKEIIAVLEKYFGGDEWKIWFCAGNFENEADMITIYRNNLHYANIDLIAPNCWEVNEQFIKIDDAFCDKWGEEYRKWIGTKQTAMNIYGYFKTFGAAVRNLALKGTSINGRKAEKVYV